MEANGKRMGKNSEKKNQTERATLRESSESGEREKSNQEEKEKEAVVD